METIKIQKPNPFRTRLSEISDRIAEIKKSCVKTTTRWYGSNETSTLGPKSPEWQEYSALKKEASVLFTALRILRLNGNVIPPKSELRKMIRKGLLYVHCKKNDHVHIFQAYGKLGK